MHVCGVRFEHILLTPLVPIAIAHKLRCEADPSVRASAIMRQCVPSTQATATCTIVLVGCCVLAAYFGQFETDWALQARILSARHSEVEDGQQIADRAFDTTTVNAVKKPESAIAVVVAPAPLSAPPELNVTSRDDSLTQERVLGTGCKDKCSEKTQPWMKKCDWPGCMLCDECASVTYPCKSKCSKKKQTWPVKCKWTNCRGCTSCLV